MADPTPFRTLKSPITRPPVQAQLDHLFGVLQRMGEAISELELRQEFVMRQIRMGRVRPGALVDPATGKLPVEHISLAELYEQQREVFAGQLMQELQALRAEEAANANAGTPTATAQGDGDDGASQGGDTPDASTEASAEANARAAALRRSIES